MLNISIREWDKLGDSDLIYSTWIKSHKGSGWGRSIPSPLYEIGQRGRIDRILEDPETIVLIACDTDTPELIYGWVVGSPDVLHYLYVKGNYRRNGIGSGLIEELLGKPIQYTHKGNDIWIEQKLRNDPRCNQWLYNPYILDKTNEHNRRDIKKDLH